MNFRVQLRPQSSPRAIGQPISTWADLRWWHSDQRTKVTEFLNQEDEALPPVGQRYRALEACPFKETRVVILGQDPYPTEGDADGLAFSVPITRKIPPTLRNILKELERDIGVRAPKFGDLSEWAHQGVLLLNRVLTVRKGLPRSHLRIGWQGLTDEIIRELNKKEGVVFILWGNDAQEVKDLISDKNNHIICAPHPSPLSAYRGFFGHRPFSRANAWLESIGEKPILWQLR